MKLNVYRFGVQQNQMQKLSEYVCLKKKSIYSPFKQEKKEERKNMQFFNIYKVESSAQWFTSSSLNRETVARQSTPGSMSAHIIYMYVHTCQVNIQQSSISSRSRNVFSLFSGSETKTNFSTCNSVFRLFLILSSSLFSILFPTLSNT